MAQVPLLVRQHAELTLFEFQMSQAVALRGDVHTRTGCDLDCSGQQILENSSASSARSLYDAAVKRGAVIARVITWTWSVTIVHLHAPAAFSAYGVACNKARSLAGGHEQMPAARLASNQITLYTSSYLQGNKQADGAQKCSCDGRLDPAAGKRWPAGVETTTLHNPCGCRASCSQGVQQTPKLRH